ncbi:MAG: hypothetical protein JOZ98_04090 [Solirubrobacterales bacterium]|nr:hypothetical protein [Solirubrobacterales bacterium]
MREQQQQFILLGRIGELVLVSQLGRFVLVGRRDGDGDGVVLAGWRQLHLVVERAGPDDRQ